MVERYGSDTHDLPVGEEYDASRPFADRLLTWWDRHGRKDLPWQKLRTPYRVWISEIMLQQTQVATVIPYFERFMERFADLPALAAAPLDEVLAAWSGLGYYARARNLHAAARQAWAQGGDLPRSARALAELPGIGTSTANAIVSQSQDVPATVMDGNVKRVMARHAAVEGWPGRTAVLRQLLSEADARLPGERGADYTQAIMDLGATLCTPREPDCRRCPVSADCRALAEDAVDRYPGPKPPPKVLERRFYLLVLRNGDGEVLLERRPPAGVWGGLWCLPESDNSADFQRRFGVDPAALRALPVLEHRLTHRLLRMTPLMLDLSTSELAAAQVECGEGLAWHGAASWADLGLPRPVQSLLEALEHPNGELFL
jgi:A/G-specific adenine glycosylase